MVLFRQFECEMLTCQSRRKAKSTGAISRLDTGSMLSHWMKRIMGYKQQSCDHSDERPSRDNAEKTVKTMKASRTLWETLPRCLISVISSAGDVASQQPGKALYSLH
ncbi:hypothetical protein CCHR01_15008 [Colletotrichum chrysophilum]|uniref:Uncharacterized protein n=1 Tax=Colletotrichum chrysophilum TaxID=1836956 RepID=A0AAD9A756_9PEZI|nr:hypothetical protein CCHR01_15008 [Colletotrichum chrysophilum]